MWTHIIRGDVKELGAKHVRARIKSLARPNTIAIVLHINRDAIVVYDLLLHCWMMVKNWMTNE